MADEYSASHDLPNLANKVVSMGGPGAQAITKRIVNGADVVGYELESGQHVSVAEAVQMAKANELKYVGVSVAKDGDEYIRSLPDGDPSNNLSSLPSISE